MNDCTQQMLDDRPTSVFKIYVRARQSLSTLTTNSRNDRKSVGSLQGRRATRETQATLILRNKSMILDDAYNRKNETKRYEARAQKIVTCSTHSEI